MVVNCIAGNPHTILATTKALCDAARRNPPRRIVHLSSMAVYGGAEGLVDEETRPAPPLNAYATARIECEALVLKYVADGGDAVIVRPSCVFGPGSETWASRIARLLCARRLGRPRKLGRWRLQSDPCRRPCRLDDCHALRDRRIRRDVQCQCRLAAADVERVPDQICPRDRRYPRRADLGAEAAGGRETRRAAAARRRHGSWPGRRRQARPGRNDAIVPASPAAEHHRQRRQGRGQVGHRSQAARSGDRRDGALVEVAAGAGNQRRPDAASSSRDRALRYGNVQRACTRQRGRAMIGDARNIVHGTTIEADLCIIGAGAAGITVALELLRSGMRIVLLEAGGTAETPEDQALYEGEVADPSLHSPPDKYRQRRFGGSTTIWGGRCVPLDAIDFEHRSWIPGSGWPISYARGRGALSARECRVRGRRLHLRRGTCGAGRHASVDQGLLAGGLRYRTGSSASVARPTLAPAIAIGSPRRRMCGSCCMRTARA